MTVPPDKQILDVTCGSRSIWFDKQHPNAIFCDKREEYDARVFGKNQSNHKLEINPDVLCDFTDLPFENSQFSLVVFDPPIY